VRPSDPRRATRRHYLTFSALLRLMRARSELRHQVILVGNVARPTLRSITNVRSNRLTNGWRGPRPRASRPSTTPEFRPLARIRAPFFRSTPNSRTRSGCPSASSPPISSTGRRSATRPPTRWTSRSGSAPTLFRRTSSSSSATARRKVIPPGSSSRTPTSPIRSAPRRSAKRNGRA
jgi:hypothetical protein